MVSRVPEDRPTLEPLEQSESTLNADSRPRRAAMRTIAVLPTMLTIGNLLCGFGSVFFASRTVETVLPLGWSPLTFAAALIFLGMVLDGLDGRVARLTRNTSELGEQLDSMADMVTFGVAPAFLAVQLIGVATPFISVRNDQLFDRCVLIIACIYVACAALRLARFNLNLIHNDGCGHNSFEGLPSPGAAGTVASLALLHQHFLVDGQANGWPIRLAAFGMVMIMLLAAFGMVSRLSYQHVVNRYMAGRVRFGTITRIVVFGLLLLIHLQGALAAGFALYAMSGPVSWIGKRMWWRQGLKACPPGGLDRRD